MKTGNKKSNFLERAAFYEENGERLDICYVIALQVRAHISRQSPGYTQEAFAKEMGVSPPQLSKWLSGNENITLDTLLKFKKVLGYLPALEVGSIPPEYKTFINKPTQSLKKPTPKNKILEFQQEMPFYSVRYEDLVGTFTSISLRPIEEGPIMSIQHYVEAK